MSHSIWNYGNQYDWMNMVRRSAMPPAIICVAVNGGVQGKEASEAIPETPEEIAQAAYEAYQAGAAMIHIHARDKDNLAEGSGDPARFREINGQVREKCPDIIINNTTGGSYGMTVEQRVAALSARPEVASLNMGPDMYNITLKERKAPLPHPRPQLTLEGLVPTTYKELVTFAKAMREQGIRPELETYNPGHFWSINYLISEGLITPPYDIQFVLGGGMAAYPTPESFLNMVSLLPAESKFSVASMGQFQTPLSAMSLLMGGNVRVGLEDNIYKSRGVKWQSNGEAVEWVASLARSLNRQVATPAQAREMLALSPVPSKY